jgi:hypothetical protein
VVSFTSQLLYPQRKASWYPLDRRLCGVKSWSSSGGEEKNSQPLSGLETPIIQTVVQRYTTELYRLHRTEYKLHILLMEAGFISRRIYILLGTKFQ